MLYRLKTNLDASEYNFYLSGRRTKEQGLFGFGANKYLKLLVEDETSEAISGIKLKVLCGAVDLSDINLDRIFKSTNGDTKPDINNFPDYFTANPVPIVTQAFRDVVEARDPNVHQFFKFSLYEDVTGLEYTNTNFYHFICGRYLEIEPHQYSLSSEMTDMLLLDGTNQLRTIVERPEVQSLVEAISIWGLVGKSTEIYVNKTFMNAVKTVRLKGFRETKNIDAGGDVQHIWY